MSSERSAAQSDEHPVAGTTRDAERVTAALREVLRAMIDGYARQADADAGPTVAGRRAELILAEAALRHACVPAAVRPPQLAVLGPTQTGKSTVVNLIVGQSLARVSPLAGFTVSPQGFLLGGVEPSPGWTSALPAEWVRRPIDGLASGAQRRAATPPTSPEYALVAPEADIPPPAGLPPCVVWDTPDFDSLAAGGYLGGVLEIAALADVHVLVLSKEKYADLTVWELLERLAPLGRPLVVVLNKLPGEGGDAVVAALRGRLEALAGPYAHAPVVRLAYLPGLAAGEDAEILPEVWELRDAVATRLKAAHAVRRAAGVRAVIAARWDRWTEPVEAEAAAIDAWRERVAQALAEAAESYRRDFLDHPQRFDTFRRATVELLRLLELPGIGGPLSQVREVLSWPARKLFAARQAWAARRIRERGVHRGAGSEETVLFELIEHLLTTLQRDAARRAGSASPGSAVWRAIVSRLDQHEGRLRMTFQQAARTQREEFIPQIHATASRLYETLRARPTLLNTLRGVRATADAASVIMAIKLGGLNVNDLVFAPAMLGLMSMLTEGALGSYMTRAAAQLKARQFEHVRTRLIEGVFAGELHALAAGLEGEGLFAITRGQLYAARAALDTWEDSADG